jgi:hypothetical protein
MKDNLIALIHTYYGDELHETEVREIPGDYDGDQYGDKLQFSVGSNQTVNVLTREQYLDYKKSFE